MARKIKRRIVPPADTTPESKIPPGEWKNWLVTLLAVLALLALIVYAWHTWGR